MAEESEKKIKAIMDKLFYAPSPRKSLPNSNSGNETSRGVKRPNMAMYSSVVREKAGGNLIEARTNLSIAKGSGQTPLCRPWDRGDLIKRLATFKSMTWFAKPQVVNAVNCARRGWINVDADTIACESCGARLFFSTPSTWTQHQVEKAALVFSLKLDSGHKLQCPWIDNACDETLAQFPPTQAEFLLDEYKKRFSALMRLLALPLVSNAAIDHMKYPLLKHFLKGSSEGLGTDEEMLSSRSYYQAQKFISLCGWEPRLLPYTVDKFSDLPKEGVSSEHNSGLVVYSSNKEANINASNDSMAFEKYDPNSVVLDCKLCGSSVGLWAFSTVPQPLELLRIVGYTDVGENNDSSNSKDSAIVSHLENRQSAICNMTIAGGPPPTKQNFKATISLPVIGRNLRARLSTDPDFRDRVHVEKAVLEGTEYGESTTDARLFGDVNADDNSGKGALVSVVEETVENAPSLVEGSSKHGKMPETAENIALTNVEFGVSQAGECSMAANCEHLTVTNGNNIEDGDLTTDVAADINHVQPTSKGQLRQQEGMEFDPIGQHRPFCPWIATTSNSLPGWQQLLSALHRQHEFSSSSGVADTPPSSLIEVNDDPITSIRNLFTPPAAKRTKLVHDSS